MKLQKYRSDVAHVQPDRAVYHHTVWLGGPSLAKITNCRVESLAGEPRTTVYVTGEAVTWFSLPCKMRYLGKVLNCYLTNDENGNLVARHCYY